MKVLFVIPNLAAGGAERVIANLANQFYQHGHNVCVVTTFKKNTEYYLENGEMMPKNGIEILSKYDAIFLGAVGAPGVPDHISLWDLLLAIRKGFDQYVNLRPVKLLKGAPCPLKNVSESDVDMVFVRENSEGEYAGSGSW